MKYLDCVYCGGRHVSESNIELCRKITETREYLRQWEIHKPTTTTFYSEVTYLFYDRLREAVLNRFNLKCSNCKREGKQEGKYLEVHHIIPRIRGGTNAIDNLTPLCLRCHHFVHSRRGKTSVNQMILEEIIR